MDVRHAGWGMVYLPLVSIKREAVRVLDVLSPSPRASASSRPWGKPNSDNSLGKVA